MAGKAQQADLPFMANASRKLQHGLSSAHSISTIYTRSFWREHIWRAGPEERAGDPTTRELGAQPRDGKCLQMLR